MKEENIFITWHYTTHGIAYLKHILSAFYKYGIHDIYNQSGICQEEMNLLFNEDIDNGGFVFDKVYYLTAPQVTFDKLSRRRFDYISNILEDEFIKSDKSFKVWQKLINKRRILNHTWKMKEEDSFVRNHYKDVYRHWKKTLWRDMPHYDVEDQIWWFGNYSNAKQFYPAGERFIAESFGIKNLRDASSISKKIQPFISKIKAKHPNANFIINSSLGSNETQVVWQVLSETGHLPQKTTLIQTYDNKEVAKGRFKPLIIKKIPNKILTEITKHFPLYDTKTKSENRQVTEQKMESYLNSGFTILLLGERGVGKTRLAENKEGKEIIPFNCASFTNNQIAESILFGHKKGAFTDAKDDHIGALKQAENNILFLDEIHHLDKLTQAKLMRALQTDEYNQYKITPLGGKEETIKELTIILASNNSIKELKQKLLPDFYDRITQLVIELPPLRNAKEDIPAEFEKIWTQMKFQEQFPFDKYISKDKNFLNWIRSQELYGNYRDLQKIAIYYKSFLSFNKELKNLLSERNAFDFARKEFERYSWNNNDTQDEFSKSKTAEEMIDDFKSRLAEWAISSFGGAPKAATHFNQLGGKTRKETLYNWRHTENKKPR
ncbi:sigma 54-interacting transcriptional regulator [Labilibacter marinus]|uniref:sigma 54-interacting transcriptional regulator n=1 Tax=Labilibacter marinus TaxID=1477105 RepID=UPI000833A559|nr:sigma 54-interacting transcriptional regulator [Labilibacter marinus]